FVPPQRLPMPLPDELREPARVSDFAAVGFPVLENLHAPNPAVGFQGNRIVDDEMLADHIVDNKEAKQPITGESLPDLFATRAYGLAREVLDCLHVGGPV